MDNIYKHPIRLIPVIVPRITVRILAETVDYNHQMMNIPAMWKHTMGEGVKVAILDSGVPNHSDLCPAGSKSFIAGYPEDFCGHGTHVGGIIAATANNGMGIAGIAPNCDDYYGVVMDKTGNGNVDNIIEGIRWAVQDIGAKVINLSVGIPAGYPHLGQLESVCSWAVSQGVTVVAAAGNESGAVGQPACYDCVLAVAAVNDKKAHAAFSDFGPEIDFAAGGVDIYSTWLNNGYCVLSGTSMAAPVITGVVALILADELKDNQKWLTPAEVKEKLKKIAFDVTPGGIDHFSGNGIPVFRNGDGEPDEPETGPVPDPSQPPAPEAPKPSGSISPCFRKFLRTASVSLDDGKSEQDAFEEGVVSVLRDLMNRVNDVKENQGRGQTPM